MEKIYNPISKKELEQIGFDYVALGHIHKTNYEINKNENIIYPGSTVSLGFDEQGEHGMIVGQLEKNNLKLQFIKMDPTVFIEEDLDISFVNSEEELIEKINKYKVDEESFYKINLIGIRKFEININEINKFNNNNNILKIRNKTKIDYDIESISKETTLKGLFAREIIEKIKNSPDREEYYNDIFEIGLEILEK